MDRHKNYTGLREIITAIVHRKLGMCPNMYLEYADYDDAARNAILVGGPRELALYQDRRTWLRNNFPTRDLRYEDVKMIKTEEQEELRRIQNDIACMDIINQEGWEVGEVRSKACPNCGETQDGINRPTVCRTCAGEMCMVCDEKKTFISIRNILMDVHAFTFPKHASAINGRKKLC